MLSSQSDFEAARSPHRETVHDLRNLFTVIVCARRLLGKDRASGRGEDLLAAIEDAAFRGSQLTTNLLARDAHEALHALEAACAHGAGLGHVQHLAKQAVGHVRIRSRTSKGAVISFVLPMSPIGVVAQSAARQRHGFQGDLH